MTSPILNDQSMSRTCSGVSSPRPVRSRAHSTSSDKPSTIGHSSLLSPPTSVSPQAAFIAHSAASQIVTNDHDSHANKWYDQHGIEPAPEAAEVSSQALYLVNGFLDHLLFNFLLLSRATTLRSLRPAVSEVLKPKLAKDAINNADEELREYLGNADEEDYIQPQGTNPCSDWDLELVWKRTRLRCMVYSSLGDLEEEDEDIYMEQENLEIGVDEQISDVISPAVAIFLTSVLEYMGELTLTVAGQAAYHRVRAKLENDMRQGVRNSSDVADRIVVEELDMERVALDRTLGRLWRGWKKRIRTQTLDVPARPFSRNSHARQDSIVSEIADAKKTPDPVEETIVEDVQAADVPLPIGENDVDEIEVPGLAPVIVDSDEEGEEEDEPEKPMEPLRPKSLLIGHSTLQGVPQGGQPESPVIVTRKRSQSLPTISMEFYPVLRRVREAAQAAEAEERVNEGKAADTNDPSVSVDVSEHAEAETEQNIKPQAAREHVEGAGPESQESNIVLPAPSHRLSKLAAVVTPPSEATRVKWNEADEDATYEEAEIWTSARVSVAGSASPPISESGKPFSSKRSSSVGSARLIDVASPKSPSISRSPSIDAVERVRPASLSRASSVSNPSNTDELLKVKGADSSFRNAAAGASGRSPIERSRQPPPMQNAGTISETEEEADVVADLVDKSSDYVGSYAASRPVASRGKNQVAAYGSSGWRGPPSKHEQTPSVTKVTILASSNDMNWSSGEASTEKPRRDSGSRHARIDSMGLVSVERTKTGESDEEPSLPIHNNSSSRPSHTSGSSVSSGTGRLKAVRTSEDNGSSRADNVARNFEELIQSNQTITYTLTPENMRDIDSKRSIDGPVVTKVSRRSEDARARNSPSGAMDPKTYSPTRPIGPTSPAARMFSPPEEPSSPVATKGMQQAGSQARDARVPAESTAEFAQFIKSTGPQGETRPTSLRTNLPPGSPAKGSVDSPRGSVPIANRIRYQPRDAVVDSGGDNSDLIDFIRQGPPGGPATHRIPRHVAPFRNTADSEQMSGAIGGKAMDATIPEIRNSLASTNVTDNSMHSMQSSVNSHTALLKNKVAMPNSQTFNGDDKMPKRKQRRVRDPYAIDFSDEEDDDDSLMTPKPPPKKEESLAEFLRNCEPPPEPVAPRQSQMMPKKKASAPSLLNMSRFIRSNSNKVSRSNVTVAPQMQSDRQLVSSRTGGSVSSRGFIPIQVNMPVGRDKYGPAVDGRSVRSRQASTAASLGRVPMKKFEPRDAGPNTSRTSDLAAFLRDSAPPDTAGPTAQPAGAGSGDSPNFSKMFARRKKSAMA